MKPSLEDLLARAETLAAEAWPCGQMEWGILEAIRAARKEAARIAELRRMDDMHFKSYWQLCEDVAKAAGGECSARDGLEKLKAARIVLDSVLRGQRLYTAEDLADAQANGHGMGQEHAAQDAQRKLDDMAVMLNAVRRANAEGSRTIGALLKERDALLGKLPVDLPAAVAAFERTLIVAALAQSGASTKDAADLLGLKRTTLVEKLKRMEPGCQ